MEGQVSERIYGLDTKDCVADKVLRLDYIQLGLSHLPFFGTAKWSFGYERLREENKPHPKTPPLAYAGTVTDGGQSVTTYRWISHTYRVEEGILSCEKLMIKVVGTPELLETVDEIVRAHCPDHAK